MKTGTSLCSICVCHTGRHSASYSNYGGRPPLVFAEGMLGVIAGEETWLGVKRHNVYYFDPAINSMARIWIRADAVRTEHVQLSGRLFCGAPDGQMQASLLPVMAQRATRHFRRLDLNSIQIGSLGPHDNSKRLAQGNPHFEACLAQLNEFVRSAIEEAKWADALVP